ncbi:unnamed protein product [Nesidiocoris tenuis]|uniref:AB hydrolase-1 domain-containing protein n=1 Tax=Nesidiocoris tenuis TaxID=355587 RepID=A0A6H5HK64_9HEMI|nr:unnamed protein product [Nesidiocoris tenuis]
MKKNAILFSYFILIDYNPNLQQLIMKEGYSHETYHVTTEDGYILQLVRILPLQSSSSRRLPVLLMHGVLSCSDTWVSRGKSQDLAFIMTDMGYDVWLGDLRGNPYTKHHKFLSPHDPRFWDFSFHEHGVYDLPAMVDFILMKSGEPRLTYVGHSMGTTVFFVFASARPEYNKKISAAVLLAPVAAKFPFEEIHNPAMRLLLTQFSVLYKNIGEQIAHLPAGSSLRTFDHFTQIFKNGFYMYDYGPKANMIMYNSTSPPLYPIQKITAPSFLFYGENDPLTSAQGTNCLANAIPGVKRAMVVPNHKYTHVDFMYGLDTNATVYGEIFRFLSLQLRV